MRVKRIFIWLPVALVLAAAIIVPSVFYARKAETFRFRPLDTAADVRVYAGGLLHTGNAYITLTDTDLRQVWRREADTSGGAPILSDFLEPHGDRIYLAGYSAPYLRITVLHGSDGATLDYHRLVTEGKTAAFTHDPESGDYAFVTRNVKQNVYALTVLKADFSLRGTAELPGAAYSERKVSLAFADGGLALLYDNILYRCSRDLSEIAQIQAYYSNFTAQLFRMDSGELLVAPFGDYSLDIFRNSSRQKTVQWPAGRASNFAFSGSTLYVVGWDNTAINVTAVDLGTEKTTSSRLRSLSPQYPPTIGALPKGRVFVRVGSEYIVTRPGASRPI